MNMQQIPADAFTRSCFIVEEGNKWYSADYSGQESAITASVSGDKKLIKIISEGGDLHSTVAKECWPDILKDVDIHDIKKLYKEYRQTSKGVEFSIFYGGTANTLKKNQGFSTQESYRIYNNFMNAFPGIKAYQDYCRKEVIDKGYILMNNITRHKFFIKNIEDITYYYYKMKDPSFKSKYFSTRKLNPNDPIVREVSDAMSAVSEIERCSINYRIQNRGAMCFKLTLILLYNYLKKKNLLFTVKITVPVHDEINVEGPEKYKDFLSKLIVTSMEKGAEPFCPNVKLTADIEVNDFWVH